MPPTARTYTSPCPSPHHMGLADGMVGCGRAITTQPEALNETPQVPLAHSQTLGNKVYEFSNHLGNVLTTFSDRKIAIEGTPGYVAYYSAEILSSTDYYPFWFEMPGRVYEGSYRYGFNGQEKVDEIAGNGNSYTAEFWQYDPRIGRRWNQDPKPNPSISNYAVFASNPIWYTDHKGDTIRVTTSKGIYLFTLDDGKPGVSVMTAKDIYDVGIQWFEPSASNYMQLLFVNANITKLDALKHFSWNDIAAFSEVNRPMTSYRQRGTGDWKRSKDGADGYLLITVDGYPYWPDAIGQIPFAVNYFKNRLREHGDKTKAIQETVDKGRQYGEGKIFGGEPDESNNYDNYFILRGAVWASKRYDVVMENDQYKLRKTNHSPSRLRNTMCKLLRFLKIKKDD